ncbi:hypothetical protein OUZ56_030879 [Daphnia magna]|uniref:Uncharacterized protein n=1 Tax=Daphnia magna TaxID=35525 RepID=A0ABQ9ZSL2_9CRUS|nr:hypothetical protein OUZ56_030879 [Daphnia magna]
MSFHENAAPLYSPVQAQSTTTEQLVAMYQKKGEILRDRVKLLIGSANQTASKVILLLRQLNLPFNFDKRKLFPSYDYAN